MMSIDDKIFYKDLSKYNFQKLIVCSYDQSIYQAMIVMDGEEHLVWENEEACFRTRNLLKMQEAFEDFDFQESVLRQDSAYDEMIGFGEKNYSNRMEVSLSTKAYSFSKE